MTPVSGHVLCLCSAQGERPPHGPWLCLHKQHGGAGTPSRSGTPRINCLALMSKKPAVLGGHGRDLDHLPRVLDKAVH